MTARLRHQPASCVETLKAQRGVAILTHALNQNRLATFYNCKGVSKGVATLSLTLSQNRLTLFKRADRQISPVPN